MLNIDGYYDCLLGIFDKGVEEGFIDPSARSIVIAATTAAELIQRMEVSSTFLCIDSSYIASKILNFCSEDQRKMESTFMRFFSWLD